MPSPGDSVRTANDIGDMAVKTYKTTSAILETAMFKLLKKTAREHEVSMSGIVNLAIAKLLEHKSERQVAVMLKREGVERRRRGRPPLAA